jgi:ribosome biogenesis protein
MNDDDEDDHHHPTEVPPPPVSGRDHQIRVTFHLAAAYQQEVPSLQVPHDVLVVPSDIGRKGLSTVINHLLDRPTTTTTTDHDDDEPPEHAVVVVLPAIPFEFMIGKDTNRILRTTGGIEREVRRLGLSMEEAVHVTYFPAQLPPERMSEETPTLPDWIGSMQAVDVNRMNGTNNNNNNNNNSNNNVSFLCTGCYDGSIVVLDATCTELPDPHPAESAVVLPMVATKSAAHHGPIHCLSAVPIEHTTRNVVIATGSMDHTLKIHHCVQQPPPQQDDDDDSLSHSRTRTTYQFDPCTTNCMGGHTAGVSSVDWFLHHDNHHADTTGQHLFLASGDWDGTVCIWDYNHNDTENIKEPDDVVLTSSINKKAKVSRDNDVMMKTSPGVPAIEREQVLSPKIVLRAHTSKVSGISWGNYEKFHSSNNGSTTTATTLLPTQFLTGSWDHSIKVWDTERQDCLLTLNGLRVVTCLDTSYHTTGIVASGHPDCTIRLWDTRTTTSSSSKEANLLVSDTTFRPSHQEWVSAVQWSRDNPYHLASTSYDGNVKLWDIRSSTPLHTIHAFGKEEKGLCVCYGRNNGYLFAGGTDCMVKQYRIGKPRSSTGYSA